MRDPTSNHHRGIVCLSNNRLDWVPTSKDHLMRAIASRGAKVLYVESIGERSIHLSRHDVREGLRRLATIAAGRLRAVGDNLWALTPFAFPIHGSRLMRAVNRELLRLQIEQACRRIGMTRRAVWVVSPVFGPVAPTLHAEAIIYHLVDDFSMAAGADAELLTHLETELLGQADVVLAASKPLADKKATAHPDVRLFPHAVKKEFLDPPAAATPAELRGTGRPRVLFAGKLADVVDVELLDRLAAALPEVCIAVIGQVMRDTDRQAWNRLVARPNARFCGQVPHSDLPAWFASCDVLLLPFHPGGHMDFAEPVVLYEYLASGRPIVATDFPAARQFGDLVTTAGSPEAFVRGVRAALENPPERSRARRAAVSKMTWQVRASTALAVIAEAAQRRRKLTDRRRDERPGRVLYVSYDGMVEEGVPRSAVVAMLKNLPAGKFDVRLVSFERQSYLAQRQKIRQLEKVLNHGRFRWVRQRKYLREQHSLLRFAADAARLAGVTLWYALWDNPDIIHARSYVPAAAALVAKVLLGKAFIFDIRGLLPEEGVMDSGWPEGGLAYRSLRWIERRLLATADSLVVVSAPFRREIAGRPGVETVPVVIPNSFDPDLFWYDPAERKRLRQERGLNGQFLMVFVVGGHKPSESPEAMAEAFAHVLARRKKARLLALSPYGAPQLARRLEELNVPPDTFRVSSCPHEMVPDFLRMADLGLCLIAQTPAKGVSSPVKFPEYLACGLPVLVSKGIGDTEQAVRRAGLGEVADLSVAGDLERTIDRAVARVTSEGEALKARCAEFASQQLSWSHNAGRYAEIYSELIRTRRASR